MPSDQEGINPNPTGSVVGSEDHRVPSFTGTLGAGTKVGSDFFALNPPILPGGNSLIHPSARIVALGDSTTIAGGPINVPMPWPVSQQPFSWVPGHLTMGGGQALGKILPVGIFGLGNQSVAQIQSIYLPLVLAMNPLPGRCVVLNGTVDSGLGTPIATYAATYAAMIKSLRQVGVEPIIGTTLPNSTAVAARDLLLRQYNNFHRRFAYANGLQVLDFFSQLVDPVTGGLKAAYNSGDNIHPNSAGYLQMGLAYSTLLVPSVQPLMAGDQADTNNMIQNGNFQGAGPVATTWAVLAAGVGYTDSLIPDPAINGNWQQTTGTAASVGSVHALNFALINTGFTAGDVLAFSCLISQSGTTSAATYGNIKITFGGVGTQNNMIVNFPVDFAKILIYHEFVVMPGTTNIQGNFATWDRCTVRFAQASLTNLTTSGVLTPPNIGV